MIKKETKQLYTMQEVADLLRVEKMTIWRYVRDGKIKAIRVGATIRIPVDEISYLFPKEN